MAHPTEFVWDNYESESTNDDNESENESDEFNPLTPDRQLPDDVLLQILSYLQPIELLSIERISRQWRRLVRQLLTDQRITNNVSTVSVSSRRCLSCCHSPAHRRHSQPEHLRTIQLSRLFQHIYDQKLAAAAIIDDNFSGQISFSDGFAARSGRRLFVKCLKKFGRAVRSIDFIGQKVNGAILLEVSRVCPYIECLAFDDISVAERDWHWFVQQHVWFLEHLYLREHPEQGRRRIVSNAINDDEDNNEEDDNASQRTDEIIDELELGIEEFLSVLADQDPRRIREITLEIYNFDREIIDLISRLQQPRDAFVEVRTLEATHSFGDFLHSIYASQFSFHVFIQNTYSQLELIKIKGSLERGFYPNHAVDFEALTQFKINCYTGLIIDERATRWLSRCRFPRLETFFLRRFRGMSQQNYSNLFQAMPNLKQLTLFYDLEQSVLVVPEPFPGVAAISRLNHVENFDLIIQAYPFLDWQGLFVTIDAVEQMPTLQSFLLDVRLYADGLHDAIHETTRAQRAQQWRREVEDRIRLMQQRRSDVDVRKKFYYQLDTPPTQLDEQSDQTE